MLLRAADFRAHLLPITLGQAAGLLCGLAGVKLSSHWVAPADYGQYGLFITLAPLGAWVTHAGLVKGVTRHWATAPDRAGFARATLASAGRKLVWLLAACVAAAWIFARATWALTALWLFLAASGLVALALGQAALQAARRNWADCGVAASGSLLRTFVPLGLYVGTGLGAGALEAGFAVFALGAAALAAWAWRDVWAASPTRGADVPAVYDGPLFVTLALLAWAMQGLVRWLVAYFHGVTEAGYLTLAGSLALAVVALGHAFVGQFFQPGFFTAATATREDRQRLAARVDRVAWGFAATVGVGVGLLHAIAPNLLGWLIAERFAPAIAWIAPAGGWLIALLLGSHYHTLLLAGGREAACARHDGLVAALLAGSAIAAAAVSVETLRWALLLAPVIPLAVGRAIARAALFTTVAGDGPAPAR